MTHAQMSQTGILFRKISLFGATCYDMAPQADFNDKAAVLNSAQDPGVLVENLHSALSAMSAYTWFSSPKLDWHLRMWCIPDKIARMHWHSFSHCVCML